MKNILRDYNPTFSGVWFFALFSLLFFITVFLRTANLDRFPPALYQDETAIGYNAYSILQTGKDEYGTKLPLYFRSFNDFKLPVYIYTTAVFEKIFGVNEYAVRLPSSLSGILSVFVLFFLVRRLTKNTLFAFVVSFLLAINPWSLQFSRAAFEVNMALFFFLFGVFLFIIGAEKKKILLLLASLLFFGLSLYSYNVTRLLIPVFLFTLCFLYWKKIKFFKKWHLIIAAILLIVIFTPFATTLFSRGGAASARGSLITGSDITAKAIEMRSYAGDLPKPYVALFYNKYVYYVFAYVQNIAAVVSSSFFYILGTTNENQGVGNVGVFYLFELPFFITGILFYFRKNLKTLKLFFVWLVLCILILAVSKEVPHATRGYFLVIPGIVFSSLGLFLFFHFLQTIKRRYLSYGLFALFFLVAFYNIQFYFVSYYLRFPNVAAKSWRVADKNLALFLKDKEKSYDKIIIDTNTSFLYTSYLFYAQYPPQQFYTTAKRKMVGDLSEVQSFGKFEFRTVDWKKDINAAKTLIVVNGLVKPPQELTVLKYFYQPTRYVVLSLHDTTVQYPVTDTEFVVLKTKE